MGIYPNVTQKFDGDLFIHTVSVPGLVKTTTYTKVSETEERTDCFCCTCDGLYQDVYCRNHGFAGKRICDIHNMPGDEFESDGENYTTTRLLTVLEERATHKDNNG